MVVVAVAPFLAGPIRAIGGHFVLFFFFALNDVDDGKLSFDFTDPIQISPDVKTKKNEIDVSRRRSFHPIPSIPLFFYLKNSISMSRFHPVSNET